MSGAKGQPGGRYRREPAKRTRMAASSVGHVPGDARAQGRKPGAASVTSVPLPVRAEGPKPCPSASRFASPW